VSGRCVCGRVALPRCVCGYVSRREVTPEDAREAREFVRWYSGEVERNMVVLGMDEQGDKL